MDVMGIAAPDIAREIQEVCRDRTREKISARMELLFQRLRGDKGKRLIKYG